MDYLFFLGRSFQLCQAELFAVLKKEAIPYQLNYSSNQTLHLTINRQFNANQLMRLLGGTVKIAEVIKVVNKNINQVDLIKTVNIFLKKTSKKFGLSFYGGEFNYQDLVLISRKLKETLGLSYRLPKENLSFSSVVINQKKFLEINLVLEKENLVIAKTISVFDFKDWSKRDYQRPHVEPSKGMLPPKVARMMVNLGISGFKVPVSSIKVLDPFCGMGTILAEAMMVGCSVIGSDIDEKAVEKTKINLDWLKKEYQMQDLQSQILVSEATHLSEKLPKNFLEAIITEPYLGPLIEIRNQELRTKNNKKLTNKYLKNIITGLEKLYLGCLKDWWGILKSEAKVVIIFPSFRHSLNQFGIYNNQHFSVKKPIDNCEKLGYNVIAGPYEYSRPQAIVIRNIYILQKSNIKNYKSKI